MEKGIKPFESADDDLYTYPFDNARIAARLKARKMRDSVALLSPLEYILHAKATNKNTESNGIKITRGSSNRNVLLVELHPSLNSQNALDFDQSAECLWLLHYCCILHCSSNGTISAFFTPSPFCEH